MTEGYILRGDGKKGIFPEMAKYVQTQTPGDAQEPTATERTSDSDLQKGLFDPSQKPLRFEEDCNPDRI